MKIDDFRVASLRFENRTAGETHTVMVTNGSVPAIMQWYGAYFAGDDYTVTYGQTPIQHDMNGEKVFDVIEQRAAGGDQ